MFRWLIRQTIPLSCVLALVTVFLIDILTPLGIADPVLYVIAVLLSLHHPDARVTRSVAIAATALTAGGYLMNMFSPVTIEDYYWAGTANRLFSLAVIWLTTYLTYKRRDELTLRERLVAEREEAVQQLRVLRGLLPICAGCKRIRDDKGYWTQVEEYLTHHSEVQFSHGLCPDCAKRLYPSFSGG